MILMITLIKNEQGLKKYILTRNLHSYFNKEKNSTQHSTTSKIKHFYMM